MSELVKRLRERADDSGYHADFTAAADRITELEARLEITGAYDGITARDETIRLLEAQLQSLVAAPSCEQLLADYRNGIPIEVSPETRALAEKVVASKSVLKMHEQELRDWAHRMTNCSNEDTRTAGESDS